MSYKKVRLEARIPLWNSCRMNGRRKKNRNEMKKLTHGMEWPWNNITFSDIIILCRWKWRVFFVYICERSKCITCASLYFQYSLLEAQSVIICICLATLLPPMAMTMTTVAEEEKRVMHAILLWSSPFYYVVIMSLYIYIYKCTCCNIGNRSK